jgi:hypothetical protein
MFEAVTAVLCRFRIHAVMSESDPSAQALLFFVADIHRFAGARDVYYNSCSFLASSVVAMIDALATRDVMDLIIMVQHAKDHIFDYYDPSN